MAVVAVAAFGVTGFVAPGFLLSDDKDSGEQTTGEGGDKPDNSGGGDSGNSGPDSGDDNGGDSGGGSGGGSDDSGGGGGDAEALIDQIVDGFNSQDETGLNGLICPGSETSLKGYSRDAKYVVEFELTSEVTVSGETAEAEAHVKLENGTQKAETDATIEVADEGSGWCWKGMSDS
ncbi:hypothetical protein BLA60_16355 [Actinophytocola xinjiangensis]|uniref:Uncharacterized protein n=1 Tax=Actinophytocola xinjiangensis TaxID=485602 RepID=A0A7Z0WM93_9PSEU|nr:hypothetical protein BLA60_16355 [Actinophytocola xinjiangensis]